MKFVTVSQTAGESDDEYLVRVEKLSRTLDFRNNNEVRQRFCVALAVNGLKDISTRRQLLQVLDLTWEWLRVGLRTKSLAKESEEKLDGALSAHTSRSIKAEVDLLRTGKQESRPNVSISDGDSSGSSTERVSDRKFRHSKKYFDSRYNCRDRHDFRYQTDERYSSGNEYQSDGKYCGCRFCGSH